MSAFTDFLHSVVSRVPFFSESEANEVHSTVEKVETELLDKVEEYVNKRLSPGVVQADDVSGVAKNTASTDNEEAK